MKKEVKDKGGFDYREPGYKKDSRIERFLVSDVFRDFICDRVIWLPFIVIVTMMIGGCVYAYLRYLK